MNKLKTIFLLLSAALISAPMDAQFSGLSGGLTFSSGIDYNTGTTGNPGIFGKAFYKINPRFHVVPAVSAYNRYKRSSFREVLKTYMLHGDLDAVYGIYKDRSFRFVGVAGFNATAVFSKWDILQSGPDAIYLINRSDVKPGINLGGAFNLYVNNSFDAYFSAKYIISSFDQVVINVGAIYYISGKRRRGGW